MKDESLIFSFPTCFEKTAVHAKCQLAALLVDTFRKATLMTVHLEYSKFYVDWMSMFLYYSQADSAEHSSHGDCAEPEHPLRFPDQ